MLLRVLALTLFLGTLLAEELFAAEFYVNTFEASSKLHLVNVESFRSSLVGDLGFQATDLALAPDETLYASSQTMLYVVDQSTALANPVGPFGSVSGVVGLDFDAQGTLWGVGQSGEVFTVNRATGSVSVVFSEAVTFVGDIAHFDDSIFFATISDPTGSRLARVDVGSETVEDLGQISAPLGFAALDFGPDDRLIAVDTGSGQVFDLDEFQIVGSGAFLGAISVANVGGMTASTPDLRVPFSRADCNADGTIDISDPVGILDELFSGGVPSSCKKACDANGDGANDIGDVIFTLGFLFGGGATPPAPFGACGKDPTADSLTCDSFAACP